MRLPCVRFTVQHMMVVIATLAVSWCMFLGIANLVVYVYHARLERDFRDGAAIWEAKKEAGHARSMRESADLQARLKQEFLSRGTTTLALIGLGGSLGGIGLAIRARYKPVRSAWPGPMNVLSAVCSTVPKIMFAGLILGGIAYVGFLLLVLAGDD